MTPYNKDEKPPIVLSAQFQSALLILIVGIGTTLLFKVWGFTTNLNETISNHEYRIHSIEDKQKNIDNRIDIITDMNSRQGRQRTP